MNAGDEFDLAAAPRLSLIACGTSSYACMVAKYWFERLAGLPADCDLGSEFADVRIEFKGFGELRTGLTVRYAGEITKGTKQMKRLGCHFLRLSPAQENLVQKFMAHIQREERAKLG